jgi:hypothetical protein
MSGEIEENPSLYFNTKGKKPLGGLGSRNNIVYLT